MVDWPLYTYPERKNIVLDVVNKSTAVAHRADYCAFWEQYIPTLLEEFGKRYFLCFKTKADSMNFVFIFRTMCSSWSSIFGNIGH